MVQMFPYTYTCAFYGLVGARCNSKGVSLQGFRASLQLSVVPRHVLGEVSDLIIMGMLSTSVTMQWAE